MEASALQAPAGVARSRISIGAPLLRLRSDEQLVSLFRTGNEDAFRVIHDRYRQRLFAYARQMLPGSRQDAEDALQDVFVRAYSALRANDRDVALRAWLYRIAHNRCIDELRRPPVPVPELIDIVRSPIPDPIAEAEQRESLRRLIDDIRRLPEQQRSALLMRELSGMTYSELAIALGISIPAIKSLLVRARVGLAQAAEARETSCSTIRDELTAAHDRRQRPNATARRHLRDCAACRDFRVEMRGVSRQLAALAPTVGPVGVIANLLGIGGGAGGSAAAGGGAAAAGGAATTGGVFAAGSVIASGAAGHVATILAAAVVTAGGAVEIQHSISAPAKHHPRHHVRSALRPAPRAVGSDPAPSQVVVNTSSGSGAVREAAPPAPVAPAQRQLATATKQASSTKAPRAGTLGGFTVPPTSGTTPTDPSAGGPTGGVTGTGSSAATPATGPTGGTTTGSAPGGASSAAPSGTSSPAASPPTATLSSPPSSATRTPSGTSGSTTPTTSGGGATGSTGSAGTSSAGTSTGSVGLSN